MTTNGVMSGNIIRTSDLKRFGLREGRKKGRERQSSGWLEVTGSSVSCLRSWKPGLMRGLDGWVDGWMGG